MEWPPSRHPVMPPPKPETAVPAGHAWCLACDGARAERSEPCSLCLGKGYWNADDIRRYHGQFPEVCRNFCGQAHVEPDFTPLEDLVEGLRRARGALRRSDRRISSIPAAASLLFSRRRDGED